MDIIKASTDWARAEVFSSQFFIFFAILFLIGSFGFRQLGKTEVAKAFVTPMSIAGILLLAVGVGILIANKARVTSFAEAYNNNTAGFIKSELARTAKSMGEYRLIVFKIIPLMIAVAALLIIFMDKPIWRASSITAMAMLMVILLVDNNANARIEAYHQKLVSVDKNLN